MRLTLEYIAVKGQTSGKESIAGKGQEESGKRLSHGLGARGLPSARSSGAEEVN